jgi:hypothetical protein
MRILHNIGMDYKLCAKVFGIKKSQANKIVNYKVRLCQTN